MTTEKSGKKMAGHTGQKWQTRVATALSLAFLSMGPPAISETPAEPANTVDTAFERLKSLEGIWQRVGEAEHGHRIEFQLTAGGSTLVEEWTYQGQPHSLTIYHRDDDTILATHYCPQGNQPRLSLVSTEGPLRFSFKDATDLDPITEQYQHDLALELNEAGQLIRSEIYRDGEDTEHPGSLTLERGSIWKSK